MVNKVTLIGNLGKDPEVRRLENGSVVGKFSVATSESWKDKDGEWQNHTEWHDVVVWRHLAERADTQFKKGMQLYIEGKLTHRSWEDQDGKKRYTTEIVANNCRILGKRDDTGSVGSFPTEEGGTVSASTEETTVAADDDLPF